MRPLVGLISTMTSLLLSNRIQFDEGCALLRSPFRLPHFGIRLCKIEVRFWTTGGESACYLKFPDRLGMIAN